MTYNFNILKEKIFLICHKVYKFSIRQGLKNENRDKLVNIETWLVNILQFFYFFKFLIKRTFSYRPGDRKMETKKKFSKYLY